MKSTSESLLDVLFFVVIFELFCIFVAAKVSGACRSNGIKRENRESRLQFPLL